MGSENYHEPYERLEAQTREMHRALVTAIEELEAIDWYQQRMDPCEDDDLREVLLHNKQEEMEHASMTLEWIRRRDPDFERILRRYLFSEGSIVEPCAKRPAAQPAERGDGSLGIGSLKRHPGGAT